MLNPCISSIVEGHGEVKSVPVLIQRIAEILNPAVYPVTPQPIRRSKGQLCNTPNVLEADVESCARTCRGQGGIFIIVDADDGCPIDLAKDLRDRAIRQRADVPIAVVVAKWEYESWFLAAATSLRGKCGLADDLTRPDGFETRNIAKGWLARHRHTQRYEPVLDQVSLTRVFSLEEAHESRSFRKCYKELSNLLIHLRDNTS